ncbi:MAG: MarR family transcriptional regulator [Nanoarchaeota archaeon]|nr:MarR family transcriptional regulator [Nanoarchaeota archaeon]MBU1051712.1 MarR family transcriptional regulator [Nanoarchaeota archaeon]MBU1988289.1 MarR family transcriptional regulator [Nanoarchaeota archaeon]
MENKKVGYLLLGISIIIIFIIFLFNNAMKEIVIGQCGPVHGPTCEMNKTIEQQTYLSLGIVAVLIIIAGILISSKPKERIILRKVHPKKKKIDISSLKPEEKQVFKLIQETKAIFQSDLIDKLGFGKAKMTRVIDRLEGQGLVERKRRGMTNIVVLKED